MYQVRTIDEGRVLKRFNNVEDAENYCDINGWRCDDKKLCVVYKEVVE